jgi:hypothetical protein
VDSAYRKDQGRAYYQALGIERSDAPWRRGALLRNLDFFGATHVAFLFLPAIGESVRVVSIAAAAISSLLGVREGKQEPIQSLSQRKPEPTNRASQAITAFRIMYIM